MMTFRNISVGLVVVAATVFLAGPAQAGSELTLTRQIVGGDSYIPGSFLDIDITIDFPGSDTLLSFGLEENLPAGWTFASVQSSSAAPAVTPPNGDTGLIEFAWTDPDVTFPVTLRYRVNVPPSETGSKVISGRALAEFLVGGAFETTLEISTIQGPGSEGEGEGEGEAAAEGEGEAASEGEVEGMVEEEFHTADQNGDNMVSLSELLRVIQFYNSDGYSCAIPPESTEDGYQPNSGDTSCVPHASDYNPQDFEINLSELLRVIQFFNSGGYFACPDNDPPTEDGFCPGML